MLIRVPQVREFMTRTPHTVGADQTVSKVREMMHTHQVRHLPVKKGGVLVGMISERSVKDALTMPEWESLKAEDIMTEKPFLVGPNTPLCDVAAAMAEEKYGSALVGENEGSLEGIFTTVDACRALRQILESMVPA